MAKRKKKGETLGIWFDGIRDKYQVNVSALAEEVGMNRATVYRILNGKPVRWKTVEALLLAIGVEDGSEEMRRALSLWAAGAEVEEVRRLDRPGLDAYGKFIEVVKISLRDVPEEDYPAVLKALSRVQVRRALAVLGSDRGRWC